MIMDSRGEFNLNGEILCRLRLLVGRVWLMFAILLLVAPNMVAQQDIYMKLGDIVGESTDQEHDKWGELSSFSFDQSWNVSGGGGKETQSRMGDIVVTKFLDVTTAPILRASAMG